MESAKIHSKSISPTICLGGKLMTFEQPRIMAIVNLNADSFYKDSQMKSLDEALRKAEQHFNEGADIIDLGVTSSRSGAHLSSPEHEWSQLLPALETLRKAYPEKYISVDTYHASVAQKAFHAGADLINDISGGGIDPEMLPWVITEKVPFVIMHMRGRPENMQVQTKYKHLLADIRQEIAVKVNFLREAGHVNLMIDPGFGFSKTLEQNYQLLNQLSSLHVFNCPVLAGVSRKSMVYRVLENSPEDALNGTTALQMLLLQQGVQMLRVHDVKPAIEAIRIHNFACKAL